MKHGPPMMRSKLRYSILLCAVLLLSAGPTRADSGYSAAFRAHWKRISDMFIQIVAAMPEDKYEFRPVSGYRSFRELVMHAIEDNFTHMGYVAGKSRDESEKLAAKYKNIKTRAEMLEALEDGYNYGDMVLSEMNDRNAGDLVTAMRGQKTTRVGAALQAFEDTMDHYGNLVVYLRLNGIVPPETANRGKARPGQEQEHH